VVVSCEAFLWKSPTTERPRDVVHQALMGCVVGVIEKNRGRIRVRMPDHYTGWMDKSCIRRMTGKELRRWRGKGMLLVSRREAHVQSTGNDQTMISLPYGAAIPKIRDAGDRVLVRLPNEREGTLRQDETVPGDDLGWMGTERSRIEFILKDAEELRTVTYTWGGTSSLTGFDCSGFIQTIFRVHGYALPRDVYQQWKVGQAVDRKDVEPGDLLFFKDPSVKSRSMTHVALALGKDGFVDAGSFWPVSLSKKSPFYSQNRASQFAGARNYETKLEASDFAKKAG